MKIKFITGKAGTGKTYMVKNMPNVIKTATTGMAAELIGGCTIHSLLKWNPANGFGNTRSGKDYSGKSIAIDEVSMLNADDLDAIIRTGKKNFWKELILVGDLKQLPPVEGDDITHSKYWNNIEKQELTKIWRQDDPEFVEKLNILREGGKIKLPNKEYTGDETVLTPYRKVAQKINENKLSGKIITSEGRVLKGKSWQKVRAEKTLKFCIGAEIIMIDNHRNGDYKNGTRGKIIAYDRLLVDIRLKNNKIVSVGKKVFEQVKDGVRVWAGEQYPFILGYAITIHKSQGMTLDKIAIDVNSKFFAKGMKYVAVSRVKKWEDLYIYSGNL